MFIAGARDQCFIRIALLPIAGFILGGQLAHAQDDKLPKAETVLDKSIEALGGRAAFEKLKTRVAKGTFESVTPKMSAVFSLYEAVPDKRYSLVELPNGNKQETGTDGRVHWQIGLEGTARLLEGSERARAERESTFNAHLRWRKLYKEVQTDAVEDVNGRPCYKLTLTPKEGPPIVAWYDQETYRPIRQLVQVTVPRGAFEVEMLFDDYRKFGDVFVACKLTQKIAELKVEQVIRTESVEYNVDIPPERFALPAAVKELVREERSHDAPPEKSEPAT
jgi:hypothetical protein